METLTKPRVRLELPVTLHDGKVVLKGSIFKFNESKGQYELNIRGERVAVISEDTKEKFPEFITTIEDE